MSPTDPQALGEMLRSAGMDPDQWDLAELAEGLEGQRAQIKLVRSHLEQADEPALRFDPRW